MNDFTTGAGTSLGLVKAAPATYDPAGYQALPLTEIGEVTNLGEIPDIVYQIVTSMTLRGLVEKKAKGGASLGNQTIVFNILPGDAGQALVDAATADREPWTLGVIHPTLGAIFARVLVMGGPRTYGGVNDPATKSVVLEYVPPNDDTTGIVAVPVGG